VGVRIVTRLLRDLYSAVGPLLLSFSDYIDGRLIEIQPHQQDDAARYCAHFGRVFFTSIASIVLVWFFYSFYFFSFYLFFIRRLNYPFRFGVLTMTDFLLRYVNRIFHFATPTITVFFSSSPYP
jgi:hypothetical protein